METSEEDYFYEQPVYYGGFWRRLAAQIVDGILLGVFTVPIALYDLFTVKSYLLYLVVGIVGALYKPLMEYKYGATLGKMALGLKCVNSNYEPIDLRQAFMRNIIFLIPNLTGLVLYYFVFAAPGFEEVTSIAQYVDFAQHFQNRPAGTNFLFSALLIVDAIVLAVDNEKRSLHDKFANTLVIYTPSGN
ncbi:MAG: hypothetical protein JWO06_2440 [Bacteroidota bacterium]|nr:hypothetical protein [Bacteroidota bacterium]